MDERAVCLVVSVVGGFGVILALVAHDIGRWAGQLSGRKDATDDIGRAVREALATVRTEPLADRSMDNFVACQGEIFRGEAFRPDVKDPAKTKEQEHSDDLRSEVGYLKGLLNVAVAGDRTPMPDSERRGWLHTVTALRQEIDRLKEEGAQDRRRAEAAETALVCERNKSGMLQGQAERLAWEVQMLKAAPSAWGGQTNKGV